MRRLTAGAAMAALACGAAMAAGSGAGPAPNDPVTQSFATCRAIADPAARLQCFDRAAAAFDTAVKAREVTVVTRQDVRQAKRSLFGFTIGRIPLFGGGDDDETRRDAIVQLDTTIVGTRRLANDRLQLQLAEGDAVWVTTEPVPFPPVAGTKVRIRRGALGNYFIAIDGAASVRGMRLH